MCFFVDVEFYRFNMSDTQAQVLFHTHSIGINFAHCSRIQATATSSCRTFLQCNSVPILANNFTIFAEFCCKNEKKNPLVFINHRTQLNNKYFFPHKRQNCIHHIRYVMIAS